MTDKIPFDVELWKSGKYDAVTRDNTKVISLLIHNVEADYPISVIFEDCGAENHTLEGKCIDNIESNDDLFLIPKKRKVWIAIDKCINRHGFYPTSVACENKEKLTQAATLNNYHIIEVELPE